MNAAARAGSLPPYAHTVLSGLPSSSASRSRASRTPGAEDPAHATASVSSASRFEDSIAAAGMSSRRVATTCCARRPETVAWRAAAGSAFTRLFPADSCGPGRTRREAQQPLGVLVAQQVLVRFADVAVVGEQLDVLVLHAAARIVVRVVGREQKLRRAEQLHRFRQLVLLSLDREEQVFLEIVVRRLLVFRL